MASPAFLGRGLIRPLRRNQNGDFASAEGAELVRSCVGQIVGTRCSTPGGAQQGELPWRTEFGSLIHLLRHAPNNTVRRGLAQSYVTDALKAWEPRIVLRSVDVSAPTTAAGPLREMRISVVFNLINSNVPGNQVVFPEDLESITSLPI